MADFEAGRRIGASGDTCDVNARVNSVIGVLENGLVFGVPVSDRPLHVAKFINVELNFEILICHVFFFNNFFTNINNAKTYTQKGS